MFEHKRPLYAFFLVAAICGIVVGTTIRSQAILGLVAPWAAPSSVVAGQVFAPAPAAADEPSATEVTLKKVHKNAPHNGVDAPPVGHRAVQKAAHHDREPAKHRLKHEVKSGHSGPRHQPDQQSVQQPQQPSGHQPGHHQGTPDNDSGTVKGFSVDLETNDDIIQEGHPGQPVISPGISGPASGQSGSLSQSGSTGQSVSPSSSVSLVGLDK